MAGITPIGVITASYLVNSNGVNAVTSAFLNFKVNSLVLITDTIEITLPPTITALNVLTYLVLTNGNVTNPSPIIIFDNATSITTIKTTGCSANSGSNI